MTWKNLGLIFNLEDPNVSTYGFLFAQGPQAVDLGDVIRIYFSTRVLDQTGKFLSNVYYVDFDHSASKWVRISDHKVIELGKLGTYDEHGIFPLNVLFHESKFLGYVGGWSRRKSVSVTTSIGIAFGDEEGTVFSKVAEGPILTASPKEPFLVGDPCVRYFDGNFHMWYIFGVKWTKGIDEEYERTYRIGHAVSVDGETWQKLSEGLEIVSPINELEAQAMPSVVQLEKNLYFMVFCYRDTFDFRTEFSKSYKLGSAVSSDLVSWTRNDSLVQCELADWFSQMMCYPNLIIKDGEVLLFLNGNNFGRNGFGLMRIATERLIKNAKL